MGQLVVDLINEAALPCNLFLQIRQQGDVAREGDHQTDAPGLVKNREAGEHQLFAVLKLLHVGSGLARAHDLRIEDMIKDPLLHQSAHIPALHAFLLQAGQLFVHAVNVQGSARGVGNEHPVGQGVKNAFDISGKDFRGTSGHGHHPG